MMELTDLAEGVTQQAEHQRQPDGNGQLGGLSGKSWVL